MSLNWVRNQHSRLYIGTIVTMPSISNHATAIWPAEENSNECMVAWYHENSVYIYIYIYIIFGNTAETLDMLIKLCTLFQSCVDAKLANEQIV